MAATKTPRVRWASQGGFPIDEFSVQSVASAQNLEARGYGLRPQSMSEDRVDPYVAVVLPNGRVVEESDVVDFARQHKGPLETKQQRIMWDAYMYILAYRN